MARFDVQAPTFDLPPPFEPPNVVELVSSKDGKIVNVRLYPDHADITRVFKFPIKVGQNQVAISGFPDVLDDSSLRVESDALVSIHDVTISEIPEVPLPTTNPRIDELIRARARAQNAINRAFNGNCALRDYLDDLNKNPNVKPSDVKPVVQQYLEASNGVDDLVDTLTAEVSWLTKEIDEEKAVLSSAAKMPQYDFIKVAMRIFGDVAEEVELIVRYAVSHVSWKPMYTIHMNADTKEKHATVIYKASITQSTGECWDNVPLTLDTTRPSSLGVETPNLSRWSVSVLPPPPASKRTSSIKARVPKLWRKCMTSAPAPLPPVPYPAFSNPTCGLGCCPPAPPTPNPIISNSACGWGSYLPAPPAPVTFLPASSPTWESPFPPPLPPVVVVREPRKRRQNTNVESSEWSQISATYEVPGLTTISSDTLKHTITIAQLELDAELIWLGKPISDSRMHLMAKIKNVTDYPLLAGPADVYLDGSLMAHSQIPLLPSTESFVCQLGADSSLRVVYSRSNEKHTKRRFFSKLTTQTFTRRISIVNTKPYDISGVKIIDHIPVSDDPAISVKLLSPALPEPAQGKKKATGDLTKAVYVTEGAVAQWEKDKSDANAEKLGANGVLNWMCNIPAGGKVVVVLSWEITSPANVAVNGMQWEW